MSREAASGSPTAGNGSLTASSVTTDRDQGDYTTFPSGRDTPMAVFFISDTHFGHGNILRYCNRPFLSEEEQVLLALGRDFRVAPKSIRRMDDAILDAINAAVGPDDVLWHLGDFCFG